MKKHLTVILILVCLSSAKAQFPTITFDQVVALKQKTIIVIVEEEDPDIVLKLSKKNPEKLQTYRDNIFGKNMALRFAIENYWNFTSGMEYKTYEEAFKLYSKDSKQYAFIHFGVHTEQEMVRTGHSFNGQPAGWSRTGSGTSVYNPSTRRSETSNVISILQIYVPGKEVIRVSLPNMYPSKGDAVYGIQQMQYILRYVEADKDAKAYKVLYSEPEKLAPMLKGKTLLIDKDDLDPKLDEQEIKKAYPFPLKVASYEEIETAIINKEPNYAFVQIVPMDMGKGNVNIFFISGMEDGKVYVAEFPKVAFGGINGIDIKTNQRIKKKHLERFADSVE
ncbi:MAG: hypothetical protein V4714_13255 [Bacteroidota bacterium]